MKTWNIVYETKDKLENFIDKNDIRSADRVLVQIFSGITDRDKLQTLANEIADLLPKAAVAGATTDGEIHNGELSFSAAVITISVFRNTEIHTAHIGWEHNIPGSRAEGKSLAKKLGCSDPQVLLLFSDGLNTDGKQFIKGVEDIHPDAVIAGGMAGDNGLFREAFVIEGRNILHNGAVAVALVSDNLQAKTFLNRNWTRVGKEMTITSSAGRRIVTIDDKPAVEAFGKYLGSTSDKELKMTASGFPLMAGREGEELTLFVSGLFGDGSIEVTEPLKQGEQVQFAYGNVEAMVRDAEKIGNELKNWATEAVFIYSCMARRRFLQDFAGHELQALNIEFPISGFFSYGEFFRDDKKEADLWSQSMTVLALSETVPETEVKKDGSPAGSRITIPEKYRPFVAMSHLLHSVTEELQHLNNHLQESEQLFRSLFEHNPDIVYSTDMDGYFMSVNPAFEKKFGISRSEIKGSFSLDYIDPEDRERVMCHFEKTLQGIEQHYDMLIDDRNGNKVHLQVKNVPIMINGKMAGVFGIGRDLTEQKEAEEQISFLAYHDASTGLPNRYYLKEKLEFLVNRAEATDRPLALLFIDLDHFKVINDSLGHQVGDEILEIVIERLKKVMPESAFLTRFGGDEFIMIVPHLDSLGDLVVVARSLLFSLSEVVYYAGREFFITASIGGSVYPDDGEDAGTLIKNADAAMFRAKQQGRNRVEFYATEMNDTAKYRLELESYLRKGLYNNEFFLCYQPIIDIEIGRLTGAEALIRWNHPKLGLVSPGDFIPIAEEIGIIEEIGRWVLFEACKTMKKWHEDGFGNLTISVNVSGKQFQSGRFLKDVKEVLLETALNPAYLNLELTESVMLRNTRYTIDVMTQLKQLGVKVSIDDFGTGYSSLSYLKDLPIDFIKIDKSFIHNLEEGSPDMAIAQAIITMGKGLSVGVLAEGVETARQLEMLKNLRCRYIQGFYINRPLTEELFEEEMDKLIEYKYR